MRVAWSSGVPIENSFSNFQIKINDAGVMDQHGASDLLAARTADPN
jgi:hypothetical protein